MIDTVYTTHIGSDLRHANLPSPSRDDSRFRFFPREALNAAAVSMVSFLFFFFLIRKKKLVTLGADAK